jgi:glycosyltransferase involved in cell wall biosynthesis
MRHLVRSGHEVSVVAPVARSQAADVAELEAAGFSVFAHMRAVSRIRETLSALARRPALAVRPLGMPVICWQTDVLLTGLREQLIAALAAGPYDVGVVHHDYAAHWRTALPPGLPSVLNLDNVMQQYAAARADKADGPNRAFWRTQQRLFTRHAARWLPAYDQLVFVSDEERRLVQRTVPGAANNAAVVANGADCAALGNLAPDPANDVVLMTGTMAYEPNADGARWLAQAIWPEVRRALPDARLILVGRDPPPDVAELAERDGVSVPGQVPDMRPWFERASVCVVPLRSGAGTRLKIAEALAARRAVVSTSLGAAGTSLADGEHLRLADRPEDFAQAVIELLNDDAGRARLAAAGREQALARFDWDALARDYERVLLSVTSGS